VSLALDRRGFCAAGIATLAVGGPAIAATTERPCRIRHYVLATRDMNFVNDQLYEFLGMPAMPKPPGPGTTEAYGFYSTMMKVGTTMLEIVQPMKPDHHLAKWLDERGGDGGYMVVMQAFDDTALLARAKAEGLTLTRDMIFRGQHMMQFDYKRFGTHFELYKYAPEDNWWGDPLGRNYPPARVASEMLGCDVAVENGAEIADQIARLFLGQREGASTVRFDNRPVNFVPVKGKARGLVAIDLKARQPERVGDWARIAGVQLRLV
jgi:hypothetical protein